MVPLTYSRSPSGGGGGRVTTVHDCHMSDHMDGQGGSLTHVCIDVVCITYKHLYIVVHQYICLCLSSLW